MRVAVLLPCAALALVAKPPLRIAPQRGAATLDSLEGVEAPKVKVDTTSGLRGLVATAPIKAGESLVSAKREQSVEVTDLEAKNAPRDLRKLGYCDDAEWKAVGWEGRLALLRLLHPVVHRVVLGLVLGWESSRHSPLVQVELDLERVEEVVGDARQLVAVDLRVAPDPHRRHALFLHLFPWSTSSRRRPMRRRHLPSMREAVLDVHVVDPLRLQPGLLFQVRRRLRPQELGQDLRRDLPYSLMIRVRIGVLVDLLLRAS